MTVLLIGGAGQLGTDLRATAGTRTVVAPPRDTLDVTRPEDVRAAFEQHRPTAVINCAAFHNVPRCEEEPERAFRVNAVAVRDLASMCAEQRIPLVTFSTDYVFDGDQSVPYGEDATPRPLQVYGSTRLAGEHAALAAASEQAIIIRTCGLYGTVGARSKGGNFVTARLAEARAGQDISMASEQVVSPTNTADLAAAVWQLLDHPSAPRGIFHLVNDGACSWYELAAAVFAHAGTGTVTPVDRGARTGAMRRPRYSALANTRARALGVTLRPWGEALQAFLQRAGAP